MNARWDYGRMFIDGVWTSDNALGVIEVIDPATEDVKIGRASCRERV